MSFDFIAAGQEVIATEQAALETLKPFINESFQQACQLILACTGRVVVMGMGKSGHIGNKIAATLASTGTPAFFVHPAEASHGDLGMITPNDVVIAISNSGETVEVVAFAQLVKSWGNKVIAITGKSGSALAKSADAVLDITFEKEADPNGLAPTTSTTLTIALGDALRATRCQEAMNILNLGNVSKISPLIRRSFGMWLKCRVLLKTSMPCNNSS